ncbi:MAG: FIST C-terminal domain-containing protein [Candidatus Omnitrophica bacterium]|jgi:hypothetical protein|nr:FIST C-terminal domain-containing protein [Candidatus Omnitrophota bacterium]
MRIQDFTIAFSQQEQEEAIKEISLKIKLLFPKEIKYLILLYTPQYHPANILKTVRLTLKPNQILGIQSPLLIFEGNIISKGIVACCLNKESLDIKSSFLASKQTKDIAAILNTFFKELRGKKYHFFSFVSANIELLSYLKEMKLSLGKIFNFSGAGYTKRYSSYNTYIVDNNVNDFSVNFAIRGAQIDFIRLEGFTPLGKSFKITRISPERNIIMEIDNQPAINVYRHYLEEKFNTFIKNRLFTFYPLGIKSDGALRLIKVLESLEDGSLLCLGELKEKTDGNIMFLNTDSLLAKEHIMLSPFANEEGGLAFIINSLSRKKILIETAEEEIKTIKKTLGDKFKMLGIFSDYYFFSDYEKGDINAETGNILLTVWQ